MQSRGQFALWATALAASDRYSHSDAVSRVRPPVRGIDGHNTA
jgi:hypothetical protein